jgi:hypothetical protein
MLEFIGTILAALLSWWRGRNQQQEAQEHEIQSTREAEAAFAAPDRDRAAVDSILLEHADK